MRKKTLAAATVGVMVFSLLTGCGSKSDGSWADDMAEVTQDSEETETEEPTEETTEKTTEEVTTEEITEETTEEATEEETADSPWLGFEEEGLTITPQGDCTTFLITETTGDNGTDEDMAEIEIPMSVTLKEVYDEDDWYDWTKDEVDCIEGWGVYGYAPDEGNKFVILKYSIDFNDFPEYESYSINMKTFDRSTGKFISDGDAASAAYSQRIDDGKVATFVYEFLFPADCDNFLVLLGLTEYSDYVLVDYSGDMENITIKNLPFYKESCYFSVDDK